MKNLNYHVNHNDLKLEGLEKLKAPSRIAAWLIYSNIKHFSLSNVGYCDVYQSKWATDLGLDARTISKAIKWLLDNQYIKLIKAYQREGNQPARYCIGSKKVLHWKQKGTALETGVNNYKIIIKQKDDDFNKSHPSSNSNATDLEKPFDIGKYKEEQQKREDQFLQEQRLKKKNNTK